jgi:quinol monooxygenase YgiN
MTAFNVVRFRVKPGHEEDFIEAFRNTGPDQFPGARQFAVVRTGDNSFCTIGEWESFDHIVDARPMMVGLLDAFRHMLEDMGSDLGVTDPVSGEAVLVMGPPEPRAKPKAKKKPAKRAKPAKKAAAKKTAKKPAKKAAKKKSAKKRR